MLIRLNRPIAGQFHTHYWELQEGDTVTVDDANGTRYVKLGLAEVVTKQAAVKAHWQAIVPEGQTACRHCRRYIEADEPWLIRGEAVPGGHLYRRPEHTRCTP